LNSEKHELPISNEFTQTTKLLERRWVSEKVFEIELSRPPAFTFKAGQTIRFVYDGFKRDYSLISGPGDPTLSLCIRFVETGAFTVVLATAEPGTPFHITGPHGYFTYKPSSRPAIFVATGTGIAPFVSMAGSGVTDFTLYHGVSDIKDLYYRELFDSIAKKYIPCISGTPAKNMQPHTFYQGRVTECIDRNLAPGQYDFYLCGRQEMVRDVTHLVDDRLAGSYIYTEVFF
jgi:NAD(P)H-flavin reductase